MNNQRLIHQALVSRAFMGTALLSVVMVILMSVSRSDPLMMSFIGGLVSYFVGTFFGTIICNIPLNDELAAVSATDANAVSLWMHYLDRWTMWNHVRTDAAIIAALLYTVGIIQTAAI